MKKDQSSKFLGFGLGLRAIHYEDVLNINHNVEWFEIITENYINTGGKPRYYLDKIAEHYPIAMHGVSLSIGSIDPIDFNYLKQVKTLMDQVNPKLVSDHLCFTGAHSINLHDLLPLPYTEDTIKHVVKRIRQVQDYLERKILIENVSSYIAYKDSEMPEWDFITNIANESNCEILLDVNNIYVSGYNHNYNPQDYINAVPVDKVRQIHLAGHSNCGDYIIDTHDSYVTKDVWSLYKKAINKFGLVSTMIERDDDIPEFNLLVKELDYARKIAYE